MKEKMLMPYGAGGCMQDFKFLCEKTATILSWLSSMCQQKIKITNSHMQIQNDASKTVVLLV